MQHDKSSKVNFPKSFNGAGESLGKAMAPPPFQLKASSKDSAELAKDVTQGGSLAQLKEKKDPKPYKTKAKNPDVEYGEPKQGPIATTAQGDANAFASKDVNQGALGDCWLLASLAAIANASPGVLQDAITGPKEDGSYDVRLYKKKGIVNTTFEAETVNVKSNFVERVDNGNLSYARGGDKDESGNEELWVKLIEKAFAKWKGSYRAINGGYGEIALEALTGTSFDNHRTNKGLLGMGNKTDEELSQEITTALAAGSPMTASTKFDYVIAKADKDENDFASQNDIVGRHEYAIIRADANGITVRNPWDSAASNPEPTMTWAQFKKYFRGYTSKA
jgi:hypothetical protein